MKSDPPSGSRIAQRKVPFSYLVWRLSFAPSVRFAAPAFARTMCLASRSVTRCSL